MGNKNTIFLRRKLTGTLGGVTWTEKNALIYDTFGPTNDAAPITSPRTCEPGPGTLTKYGAQSVFATAGGNFVATVPGPNAAHSMHTGDLRADGVGSFYLGVIPVGGAGIARVGPELVGGNSTGGGWQTNGTTYIRPQVSSTAVVDTGRSGSGPFSVGSVPMGTTSKQLFFDGARWVLDWVAPLNDNLVAYGIYTFSGAATIADMRVLPLADYNPAWGGDWTEVTDTKTNPATNTNFACNADFHLKTSFTYELGVNLFYYLRYLNTNNRIWLDLREGNCTLKRREDGSDFNIGTASSVLSDGVSYTIDLTGEGPDFQAFLDGVKIFDGSSSFQQDVAQGRMSHTLSVNDIVLTTHPYPALGIATSRVIAPQDDDTFTHENDFIFEIKNITIPAGADQLYRFRESGPSGTDALRLLFEADGGVELTDRSTGVINAGTGSASNGDDVVLVVDGVSAEIFVNGASIGSTSSIPEHKTGTTGDARVIASGESPDSIACYPRDVSSLLPPELT